MLSASHNSDHNQASVDSLKWRKQLSRNTPPRQMSTCLFLCHSVSGKQFIPVLPPSGPASSLRISLGAVENVVRQPLAPALAWHRESRSHTARSSVAPGRVCGATGPAASGRRDIRSDRDRAGRSHLPVRLRLWREVCALPQTRGVPLSPLLPFDSATSSSASPLELETAGCCPASPWS